MGDGDNRDPKLPGNPPPDAGPEGRATQVTATPREKPAPAAAAARPKAAPKKSSGKASGNKKPPAESFLIVGIGCSAGGLEALEAFFAHVPADTGMGFVVIQHLSPQHKSILGDILKRDTKMPVMEITDRVKIIPDHVYFNPPGQNVSLSRGAFRLQEPVNYKVPRLPIDFFFRALAEDQGEQAICIVLSGTGSDGTLGLEAVKGAGGMTMAQAEAQAKYPFMPRSAIATGMVDCILPVEKMPEELLRYAQHPYLRTPPAEPEKDTQHFDSFLQKILRLVQVKTKHDFTHYKPNTIRRRIERRLAVHKIKDIAHYHRFLLENPGEVQTLFKDLVICVTSFFRDPEAFKSLEEKAIPEILARQDPGEPVRVWVAGCATGEEALSLAILFAEAIQNRDESRQVQIFATDIDPGAIERARAGIYPESIAADVNPERLSRFFTKVDSQYKVKPEIREMVVYAPHNLISDPLFRKLDLLSCRNVLIYMDMELQKQLLEMFLYCLLPGGFLFLGTSETVGHFSGSFETVDQKNKIFRRQALALNRQPEHHLAFRHHPAPLPEEKRASERPVNAREFMEKIILTEYAPPAVLVDDKLNILFFQGDTSKFLVPPQGEPSFNLLKMARKELRPRLLSLVHQAVKQKRSVTAPALFGQEASGGKIAVHPLTGNVSMDNLVLVIFSQGTPPTSPPGEQEARVAPEDVGRVRELEQELAATKEYLQTTIEELETSNEELKSTNEELQSLNEELQSTNEEVETAKEELQSTNEELLTVNSELHGKLEEVAQANDDLNNFLTATEIGTIFLDNDLKVQRFTPKSREIFNLIPTDLGRPLQDITNGLRYDFLIDDVQEVLNSLQVKEEELSCQDGRWYRFRIMPYRTVENIITGAIITFTDVTELKLSKDFAENVVATIREPLMILDKDLKVVSVNPAYCQVFQTPPAETIGRSLFAVGGGEWENPALRRLLEEIIIRNQVMTDFEVKHDFPRLGHRTMILNARRLPGAPSRPEMILLAFEDVSEAMVAKEEMLGTVQNLQKQVAELTDPEATKKNP